jgi:predicted RNA-binding protein with RPS1 domain
LQKVPVKKVEDVLHEGQAVEVWVRKVRKDRIELTMIKPLQYEWKELAPGMVTRGKVVRLESYGAFVDIGAERPGMIHISELSRGYVKTAADVVKEGDEVEAQVLSVDAKKRQIRLSLKALQPEMPEPEKPQKPPARRSRMSQTRSRCGAAGGQYSEQTAIPSRGRAPRTRPNQTKGSSGQHEKPGGRAGGISAARSKKAAAGA